jgi:hypothetical protein
VRKSTVGAHLQRGLGAKRPGRGAQYRPRG